jgi:hypothetical protein
MRRLICLVVAACSSAPVPEPAPAPPPVAPPAEPAPPAAVVEPPARIVSAGYMHQCCAGAGDRVVCNGSNAHNELAVPDAPLVAVSAGLYATCAIDTDGKPRCWGDQAPAIPETDRRFARIVAGDKFACALDTGGAMSCWHAGDLGATPSGRFRDLVAGWDHVCGLRLDGEVVCTGRPPAREPMACADLENAAPGDRCEPGQMVPRGWTAPPGGLRARLLGGGSSHNCAQTVDGPVVCWGAWGHGDGNSIWSTHLFPPDDLETDLIQLTGGGGVSCALTRAGRARCWGHQSDLPGTFVDIDGGAAGVCGARSSGALECFTHSVFAGAKLDATPLTCRVPADNQVIVSSRRNETGPRSNLIGTRSR